MKKLTFFIILILLTNLACSFSTDLGGSTSDSGNQDATAIPDNNGSSNARSGAVSSIQDVKNAVVQIEAQGTFIDPQVGLVVNGAGRGSGFLVDPSGIIVTNNHVVTGAALVKVFLNGEQYKPCSP